MVRCGRFRRQKPGGGREEYGIGIRRVRKAAVRADVGGGVGKFGGGGKNVKQKVGGCGILVRGGLAEGQLHVGDGL